MFASDTEWKRETKKKRNNIYRTHTFKHAHITHANEKAKTMDKHKTMEEKIICNNVKTKAILKPV